MNGVDARKWLDDWAGRNLDGHERAGRKAAMRDAAEACAKDATAAGLSIQDLKTAAGGDLEVFLMERENQRADDARSA